MKKQTEVTCPVVLSWHTKSFNFASYHMSVEKQNMINCCGYLSECTQDCFPLGFVSSLKNAVRNPKGTYGGI